MANHLVEKASCFFPINDCYLDDNTTKSPTLDTDIEACGSIETHFIWICTRLQELRYSKDLGNNSI